MGETKLFFAHPTYDGRIDWTFAASLLSTRAHLTGLGVEHSFNFLPGCPVVELARNALVRRFLATDSTHMIWVDVDQTFEPQTISRMVDSGLAFVGAPVPFKTEPTPLVGLPEFAADGCIAENRDGFVRALHVGLGGPVLMARNVLERMARDAPTHSGNGGTVIPRVFKQEIRGGEWIPEDIGFCRAWRELGGTVWLDSRARVTHWGRKEYTSPLLEDLMTLPRVEVAFDREGKVQPVT